ncbi:MAG: PAS domain S-box protein [Methanoregula sp.]|jgi:PAS domain S-box-containing protein
MISILYVDDEPGLLELCRIFLEQTGEFRVDTVESAEEALVQLKTTPYDAVISDFQMPVMDGISLLKSIRQQSGDIPFILFTGRGREEVVIEAINNGADFYLQKGGDPKSQFVELMHKVRQAVGKRQVKRDLHESEKRLTDIINFLPDATFAIDRSGKVIAWNRAIEEITGIPAAEMLGKGDHEYAIPFYGHRRPVLIDLIFEPDELIQKNYADIRRENKILIAESDLPRPQGKQLIIRGKASPLYDPRGNLTGAIETIRDITARKMREDELRAAYEQVSAAEEELRDQYNRLSENEQVLRDSEEKYRTLVENSRDVIYIYRGDHFLHMNKRGSEVTGYTHEGLMQMKVWDFLHPDDLKRVFAAGKARIQGADIPTGYTARILTKSGKAIPMELVAVMIMYQGEPAIMGIARDVTERDRLISGMARITKTLTIINRIIQIAGRKRNVNELLDTALSSIRDCLAFDSGAVYLIDEGTGRARIVSSHNLPPEFIRDVDNLDIHKPPYDSVFVSGIPVIKEHYDTIDPERAAKAGAKSVASIPIVAEDRVIGALNVASSERSDIPPEEREVLSAIGTELGNAILRMNAETALQESEAKYRSMIDNLQDMLYRTDMDGRITMVSPAGAKRAGFGSAEEMIGLDLAQVLYADPHERKRFLTILAKKGSVNEYPLILKDRNGERYHVTASSHYFSDPGGHVIGVEGIIHDVTHLRQAEDALKEANRKLNLLNSITRHDVANQLTVLQGYTQLALVKKPDLVITDFLQKIDSVTTTIGRQIEFSKEYQELGVHDPGWYCLDDIFARTKPKEILFSSSCSGAEIFADPMLEKVFANLFGNSVMHGEHVSRITVRCEPAGDDLGITVEDNGVGIPLDLKQKIFKKGFGKNTGFGLFLAREILAITGISIHETGRHGSGARFEITVPKSGFRFFQDDGDRDAWTGRDLPPGLQGT